MTRTIDKTILTILLVLLLVIAIPAALFFRKLPDAALTPAEKELVTFSSRPIDLSSPRPRPAFTVLASPIKAAAKPEPVKDVIAKSAPRSPAPQEAPVNNAKKSPVRSLGSLPVLSMISYDGETKTAIINSSVVTEGSEFDGGKIMKIEENRVLMRKAGKTIWLTIE